MLLCTRALKIINQAGTTVRPQRATFAHSYLHVAVRHANANVARCGLTVFASLIDNLQSSGAQQYTGSLYNQCFKGNKHAICVSK